MTKGHLSRAIQAAVDKIEGLGGLDEVCALGIVTLLFRPLVNETLTALGVPVVLALVPEVGITLFAALRCLVEKRRTTGAVAALAATTFLCMAPQPLQIFNSVAADMCKYAFPMLLFALCIHDYATLFTYLRVGSDVGFYVALVCVVASIAGSPEPYSMSFGYRLCIIAMVLIWGCVSQGRQRRDRRRIVRRSKAIICIVMIVLRGSRAPLLLALIWFFVLRWVYYVRNVTGPKRLMLLKWAVDPRELRDFLILAAFLVPAVILMGSITGFLYDLLLSVGIDVRTLRVLSMPGALTYVSGRDLIYGAALQEILRQPVYIGRGLACDRALVGSHFTRNVAEWTGWYAHNVVLEALLEFGVIPGTVAICALSRAVYARYKTASGPKRELIRLAVVYLFVFLNLSGSYLTTDMFWLLMGLTFALGPHSSPAS